MPPISAMKDLALLILELLLSFNAANIFLRGCDKWHFCFVGRLFRFCFSALHHFPNEAK